MQVHRVDAHQIFFHQRARSEAAGLHAVAQLVERNFVEIERTVVCRRVSGGFPPRFSTQRQPAHGGAVSKKRSSIHSNDYPPKRRPRGKGTMKDMRLRKAQGKLKIEHSIIGGVRELLERLLAENPGIRSVIPGVIKPVRDARGEVKIRVTVPTTNGWKAIALSAGARQELFVSTAFSKERLEDAFRRLER